MLFRTDHSWQTFLMALFFAGSAAAPASAAIVDLEPDDYRVFCGYLDALDNPKVKDLSPKKRDRKIAKMAKLKVKDLLGHVDKARQYGDTCEEVGKRASEVILEKIKSEHGSEVEYFELDTSDPSHVVAAARWRAKSKKTVAQEGLLLAHTIAKSGSIAKTIAIRGVNPKAPDTKADSAIWFEAKSSPNRLMNINIKRIKNLKPHEANQADRYLRVFDGLVRK